MLITYTKYHALGNDFLVIEASGRRLTRTQLSRLAKAVCDRRTGVGADGILYLTASRKADQKFSIFNADGSWAEKSGNGLRIAGLHLHLTSKKKNKKQFTFETSSSVDNVTVIGRLGKAYRIRTELGSPRFETSLVPIKSRLKFMINAPLKIGGHDFPVTCLSVGNPHTVLFVDGFDFEWQQLGEEIECHKAFPNKTNVEFVKVLSRTKLEVADWERGAGATGSSGTGAAAAVCASVIMGFADRLCEVVFPSGSLWVEWVEMNDQIELTGPAEQVARGTYEL